MRANLSRDKKYFLDNRLEPTCASKDIICGEQGYEWTCVFKLTTLLNATLIQYEYIQFPIKGAKFIFQLKFVVKRGI